MDYIKWQAYIEAGNPVACSNPDIFEPLLKLFERGRSIGFHNGEIIVGGFAILLGRWRELSDNPPII